MRRKLTVGVAVVVVMASAVTGCGTDDSVEDGGTGWGTCDGYRQDVAQGSAQDIRDLEKGRNPCY